jgi:crotonobetainyl-CoA:carnitine CoA-transferase CaiB-like acyl-CoA transferase
MILGDLGAEVILLDMPRSARNNPTVLPYDTETLYLGHNRNKKSIAVNLKTVEGKEIFYRLVEKVDVIVEPNRPGVLKRRGMDYESVCKINPKLIYCSITSYGQDGPYAQRTGHEINFSGITGIMALTGSKNGPPVYLPSPSIAGLLGGTTQAVIAIIAALYSREMTGKGQYIDVSITDGVLFFHWTDGVQYLLEGRLAERAESPTGSDMACFNCYQAKDGNFFTVGCAEPSEWANLCRLVEREDLIPHQFGAIEKQKEMYTILSNIFITEDCKDWMTKMEKGGVCAGPVYGFEEIFSDPHFQHREVTVELEHPKKGKIKVLNTPFKFSETPAQVRSRPPLHSEHTREVLSNILGYSNVELEQFSRKSIID